MRASIAAEIAGVPSVSIVCEGFERQALATARGHGFDDAPLASLVGHVDAQSADEMLTNFVEVTVPQIIDGLTGAVSIAPMDEVQEPAALDSVGDGTLDEIQRLFRERGWSDGSPVIPPTRAAVEAFISPTGHDPWRVLGTAKSSGRDVSVWSIAVNAVMAGCAPEHLPILLAIAEILVDPRYGAEHSGNTTGADALMILDSRSSTALGFETGQGAMREGARGNTSIGRWLRLYLRNVFEFTADKHDKATFGNSARVLLAEDVATLDDIGWRTLAGDHGVAGDAVSMARMNSGIIVGSVTGSHPDEIVPYLADGLARVAGWDLTHNHGLGHAQFRPLLVLSPVLARTIAAAGWSKDDLRRALFEQARIPAQRFEKLIGEWSNLTPGRRSLVEHVELGNLPPVFAETDDPERLVPIVCEASKFMVAVAGDPNRTNAYVFANDGPHGDWTTKAIDFTPSQDLVCSI